MVQIFIGIGAGAAAALLFASVASGSIISVLLFYLAPLPIMLAALGWSHWAGLVAAVVASLSLGAVFGMYFFTAFIIGIALPAWWLGYLALLARPGTNGSAEAMEWFPPGRLLAWSAIIGTTVVTIAVLSLGFDEETFHAGLRRGILRVIQFGSESGTNTAAGTSEYNQILEVLLLALPAAAAVVTTITNAVNFWLAARIVAVSGRLQRPMPELAAMTLPGFVPMLMAAAVAGTFIPGMVGVLSSMLAASLSMAYAVLGFAVLHAVTRGLDARMFILIAAYAAVFMFGWPVLAMTLLGLAETALNIRRRAANRAAAKGGPPAPPRS